MARERRELAARSEGKTLYLRMDESGWEKSYDWDGPPGAHHAVLDEEHHNHPYGHEYILRIEVYDAAGKHLGLISKEEWS